MKEIVVSPTLIRRLATARSAAVLTGAGISAESGVPTFRDEGGLWQRFRPEELANVDAFLANPVLVQAWYRHRLEVVTETQPNPGHEALSMLEEMIEDFTIITQNVDNLHRRAGGQNVLELHGNIARSYCIDCEASVADLPAVLEEEAARCDACGGLIRPDVVWFGEMLPEDVLRAAYEAAARAEVFLSVGTSAVVYPAAGIPLEARRAGAYVAEVNVEPSAIAHQMNEVVLGPAGEALPAIVERVRAHRAGNE